MKSPYERCEPFCEEKGACQHPSGCLAREEAIKTPEEKFYDEMVERQTIELGDMWGLAAAAVGHHLELKLDKEHKNASAEWRQGFKRALLYLKAEE